MLKDSVAIRAHTSQERGALSGARKKRWSPVLSVGHPHGLTHPSPLSLMQTTEFLEGRQVGGRRKEKGGRRGKKRGREYGLFVQIVVF